jgi:hypothetical protein
MGYLPSSRPSGWISVVTVFVFSLASCAPVQIQRNIAQKAGDYRFTTREHGFQISADPYKEEKRLHDYFGCDLLSRGVLPVLVVIENRDADDGYSLINEKASLMMKNTDMRTGSGAVSADDLNTDELHKALHSGQLKAANVLTPLAALAFPLLIPAAALGYSAKKRIEDEVAIRRNLEDKQITNKTLYRGGTQSGFLYFPINKENIEAVQGIKLSMKNLRSNETVSFTINMISE